MAASSSNMTSTENHLVLFDPYCSEFLEVALVWSVTSVPCILVGVPASCWLLWVLIERQRGGSFGHNIYTLNLTFMDVNFNISTLFCLINFYWWQNWIVYGANNFLWSFNALGRPLFMAFICIDCYIAVDYPLRYMKMRQSRHQLVVCVLIWIVTLAFAVVMCLETDYISLGFNAIPNIFTLPVIVACDIAIICALRKPDVSGRADLHPQKKRALQTITSSLVLALLCCVPPIVGYTFSPLMSLSPMEMYCQVSVPVYVAPTLASLVMPLFQLQTLGKLRDLKRLLCAANSCALEI